ncbi:MAG: type IV secretory system conjugative DNA transfer family protein [Tissierellia bacterium]|nr:type IV secretory system conjugative DNA transfer family protein [Tissierellia bacterium]
MAKKNKQVGIPTQAQSLDLKSLIIIGVVIYLLFLYYLLHVSSIIRYNESVNLNILLKALTNLTDNPFEIGFDTKIVTMGSMIFIGIYAMVCMYLQTLNKIQRAVVGDEQGSAEWFKDLNAYNRQYSYPKGQPFAEITHKKTTSWLENLVSNLNKKNKASKNNEEVAEITDKLNGKKKKKKKTSGKPEYLKHKDFVISPNMIFSKNVTLSMFGRDTMRSNNILVIGGTGTGKSRFFVKPNLLQCHSSYVITDPSGELLQSHGQFLKDMGYKLKVFNLVDMQLSNTYNPFNYIRDENGIMQLINTFIANTTPKGANKGDPFWEKAESMLLMSIMFYLYEIGDKSAQTLYALTSFLTFAIPQKEGEETKLDGLFFEHEKNFPDSQAVINYKNFKQAAGDTAKSIVISAQSRLAHFTLRYVRNLTDTDTIDLTTLGKEKTALFCILPSADTTFNFLVSLMYSQLFESLYYQAEHEPTKRLKVPVRFLLDEFANIGTIPDFTQKLATMRKYEISCSIILQNLNQLEGMYKDDWKSIVGNTDVTLFLGSGEKDTQKYMSELLGNTTIETQTINKTKSQSNSTSFNKSLVQRPLMTPDEIGVMDNSRCLIFLRGERPFNDEKYPYQDHPMYRYCGDGDDKKQYMLSEHKDEYEVKQDILVEAKDNSPKYTKEEVTKVASELADELKVKDLSELETNVFELIF